MTSRIFPRRIWPLRVVCGANSAFPYRRLRPIEHGPAGGKRREDVMVSEGAGMVGANVGNGDIVVDDARFAEPGQPLSPPPGRLRVMVREPEPAGALFDVPLLAFLRPGDPDIGVRKAGRQIKQHDRCSSQLAAKIGWQATQVEAVRVVEAGEDRAVQGMDCLGLADH
jgi:hypothetical protein